MLDPLAAADILADIGYLLAPVVGPLGGVVAKEKGDVISKAMEGFDEGEGEGLGDALDKAFRGFFDRMTKEKQRELMKTMAKMSMVVMDDGKEPPLSPIFNSHFKGRVMAMYQWVFFALKTQFSDFFTGADAGISQYLVRKQTGSTEQ